MTTQPNSQIGYPMAKNLRAKIPAEDTLFVHDVNTAATKQFLDEHPQGVRVAENVREVAEKAVRTSHFLLPLYDELIVLSMI
jgi:3-hydroxyisobutyrate dehydrogenase-like beta-hydroxyacid dehydrogenase